MKNKHLHTTVSYNMILNYFEKQSTFFCSILSVMYFCSCGIVIFQKSLLCKFCTETIFVKNLYNYIVQ